jgi:hypothetical protein
MTTIDNALNFAQIFYCFRITVANSLMLPLIRKDYYCSC